MTALNIIIAAMLAVFGWSATSALAVAAEAEAAADRESDVERIEVAFVLDTTGSMEGLIEGAKAKIFAIADDIRRSHPDAEVRFGLVGYRDIGDVYVTDVMELNDDIHAVYGRLMGFTASGGGDWPESVNEALNRAVTGLDWTEGKETRRLVFLVGDAPPHMDYAQDVPFTDTARIANENGIIINAVQAGDAGDTEVAWRAIASLGGGEYIAIPQQGGVVIIETPYDQRIYELQIQLSGTVVPYGSPEAQAEVDETIGRIAAAPAPAASDMASYGTRTAEASGGSYEVVAGGDLVADIVEGRVALEDVADEELPGELRALSVEERAAELEGLATERARLQTELEGLVAQRDVALAEATVAAEAGGTDGFDQAVEEVLGRQLQ